MRLLLVEDDPHLGRFIQKGLQEERYAVDLATDGEEGLCLATVNQYDLIILDIMLPKLDGFGVCRKLRADRKTTPILMLTAREAVEDKVAGLDTGADDYLTKPFAFAELVARVQALARRSAPAVPPVLEHDGVLLDPARRFAARDGCPLDLTPKEYAVLEVLLRSAGQAVSTEELLERAWDAHADPFTNAVRVAVMTLRRKLGDPPLIATVPRFGYRFGG